jgi:AraC-like DNA-binding protein
MYREFAPPAAFARWVECIWRADAAPTTTVLPDGCIDIVYLNNNSEPQLVGAMTAPQIVTQAEPLRVTGIRFHPGMARPFIHIVAAEITDTALPLNKPFSLTEIELPQPNPVQKAIEAMRLAHGEVDIDYIASQASLSPRQFRRRCLEESGITPKLLCRILRFRHASQLAGPAACIALDAGYFDQAHMSRDFRQFSGSTPMSVFSNRLSR